MEPLERWLDDAEGRLLPLPVGAAVSRVVLATPTA